MVSKLMNLPEGDVIEIHISKDVARRLIDSSSTMDIRLDGRGDEIAIQFADISVSKPAEVKVTISGF